MNPHLTSIIDEFRAEAAEHLDALNAQLLKLEREPTATEPIRAMFLSAHTIKGSAAMLDLADIRVLAHAMEDVLARLRDSAQALDAATADLLFQAIDTLRRLVGHAMPGLTTSDTAVTTLATTLRERAGGRAGPGAADDPPREPASHRPRALLVEDSATVRLLETLQLEEAGFDVDALADGREALALALTHGFDLVVTGVETRGLHGWDLVESLRNVTSRRTTPIIVMSCDAPSERQGRADALGVHAYLPKGSLMRQQLVEVAREVLNGRVE